MSISNGEVGIMVDEELDPIKYDDSIGIQCGEETVPIEVTRPIFNRDDYVLVKPIDSKIYICPTHNISHEYYTHGCQPVAMAKSQWIGFDEFLIAPATVDSVPYPVTHDCKIHRSEPHIHQDFRWQS